MKKIKLEIIETTRHFIEFDADSLIDAQRQISGMTIEEIKDKFSVNTVYEEYPMYQKWSEKEIMAITITQ